MIFPPWYDGPVETLAFNMFAMRECAVEEIARAIYDADERQRQDGYWVRSLFDLYGLAVTSENAERVQYYLDTWAQ